MSKDFEADSVKLHKVFEGKDAFYRIPDYQRPYSWGENEINQLWEDLYEAWKTAEPGDPEPYFLGSVILIDEDRRDDDLGRLDILDGQQRITTLLIFYTVLRDCYPGVLDLRPDINRRIIRTIRGDKRYRLQTGSSGKASFIDAVLDEINFDLDNTYVQSAKLTKNKLDQLFDDTDQIVEFFDFVEDSIELVLIRSSNLSHAIRMFQTINTRGKGLTISDLMKSYLLYKTSNLDEREAVIDTWKEITVLFNNNYSAIDSFLSSYRFYRQAAKPEKAVYEELREDIETRLKEGETVVNIINDIATYGKAYTTVKNEKTHEIYTLSNLNHGLYWPSILAGANKEGFDDIEALKHELIAFYYSYWIAGHTAEKIKNPSASIMRRVKRDGTIKSVREKVQKKREKDSIAQKVQENLYDDVYRESWHRRLLVSLEYQLRKDGAVSYIEVGEDLHCEHVLPKAHEKAIEKYDYWSDRFDNKTAAVRKHTLGNIVPLERELNSSAQIRGFDEKRDIYLDRYEGDIEGLPEKTTFELTLHLVDTYPEWDETSIESFRETIVLETAKLLNFDSSQISKVEEEPISATTVD